jgi:hypothetical protein
MEIRVYFATVSGGAESIEKPVIAKEITFGGRFRYVHS